MMPKGGHSDTKPTPGGPKGRGERESEREALTAS